MEFREVVRRRRMVRSYTDEPVDPAVVERALAHATRAPSAGFSQGWGFLVLDTPEDVAAYWRATSDDVDAPGRWLRGMMRAPVVVVPCSSKAAYLERYAEPDKGWTDRDEARWPVPYWHTDAAMAALLILQTAVDEGLGACLFGDPGRASGRAARGVRHPRHPRPRRSRHARPPGRRRRDGLAGAPRPTAARGGRAPRPVGRRRPLTTGARDAGGCSPLQSSGPPPRPPPQGRTPASRIQDDTVVVWDGPVGVHSGMTGGPS